jgi:predicted transcriptional regulator
MKKILLLVFVTLTSMMAIELGSVPSAVTLSGEDGSKIDGTPWSSSMLKDKVYILFYVDPDERDLNNAFTQRLKAKQFDKDKLKSIAIINLAATWLPNVILESMLEEKQEEYPNTLYVKDRKKILVDKWKLADDTSDILLFNPKGELLYKKFGKLNDQEITEVITLIEDIL